jgi:hypothetical protein
VFGLAIFMLGTLISVEIAGLQEWGAVTTPLFVGKMIGAIGAVGTAWLSGKLAPQPGAEDERCPSCNAPIHNHEEPL